MQWLHRPYDWFEREKTMENASIHLIHGQTDMGRLFVPPQ
jgi:hypothetical protein